MNCLCCSYQTKIKCNFNKHLASSRHIMKSMNVESKKENPILFNKRLITENKFLKEKHELTIKNLIEEHKLENEKNKQTIKDLIQTIHRLNTI